MMAVEDEQWWVSIPHHINYFSFDSIQKLLENAGFKIIVKEADFPLEFFLLMGDNYVKDSKLGKQCHLKRTKFEETIYNTELRKGLYKSFAENNIGRDIIMIGQLR